MTRPSSLALRAWSLVCLMVLLSACISTAQPPPLPKAVRVTSAAPDLPKSIAAFAGTWVGGWGKNMELRGILVVEKIEAVPTPAVVAGVLALEKTEIARSAERR